MQYDAVKMSLSHHMRDYIDEYLMEYLEWYINIDLYVRLNAYCSTFAQLGNFEMLIYAIDRKYTIYDNLLCDAITGGNLNCVKYLHECGIHWIGEECNIAAKMGNIECLKYAHANGCPINWITTTNAAASLNRASSIECLKYLHENGCKLMSHITWYAAISGNVECIAYAYDHGCILDEYALRNAIQFGHFECLEYLSNKCELTKDAISISVISGQLECLMFLHKKGCPYDKQMLLKCAHIYSSNACHEYVETNM